MNPQIGTVDVEVATVLHVHLLGKVLEDSLVVVEHARALEHCHVGSIELDGVDLKLGNWDFRVLYFEPLHQEQAFWRNLLEHVLERADVVLLDRSVCLMNHVVELFELIALLDDSLMELLGALEVGIFGSFLLSSVQGLCGIEQGRYLSARQWLHLPPE